MKQYITYPETQVWWITDGLTKRPLQPGEQQVLVDLGVVRPERDANGNIKPKVLTRAQVDAIPSVFGPDQ